MQKEKDNSHTQACEQPKMLIIGWALTLSTFFFPVLSVYARTQFLVVVTLPLSICDITAWTIWVPNRSELKMGTDYHSTCTKSKAKIHICCTILEFCICSPGNACHVTSIVIQHTQGQVQWQVANAKQEESCGSLFQLPRDSCRSQEDVTQLTAFQLPFHGLLDNPVMVHPHLFPSIRWLSFTIVHLRFKDATWHPKKSVGEEAILCSWYVLEEELGERHGSDSTL